MLEKNKRLKKVRLCITLDEDIVKYLEEQKKQGYNMSQAINAIIRNAMASEKK
jgi:uncharacterized protein (DUF4415 family)